MVIPWQFCRTIGPLLSQRFPLASAKAQPRGGFKVVHLPGFPIRNPAEKLGFKSPFLDVPDIRKPSNLEP